MSSVEQRQLGTEGTVKRPFTSNGPKPRANRMFFLSIPPNVFVPAAGGAADYCSSKSGWTRVIVEKPFGRDSESSKELSDGLAAPLSADPVRARPGGRGPAGAAVWDGIRWDRGVGTGDS